MRTEVPIEDLRLSEYAPDRSEATRAWAAAELERKRAEQTERLERQAKQWVELGRASDERRAQLRLEAVKRGEVYIPPPPPPMPVYSASSYGWGGATAYRYR